MTDADSSHTFTELTERARAVRRLYEERERQAYGRSWSAEELMLGFVKDVGDLAVLVQRAAGIRADAEGELAHELSDCLWSVIVLADALGCALEPACLQTMDELQARLNSNPGSEGEA